MVSLDAGVCQVGAISGHRVHTAPFAIEPSMSLNEGRLLEFPKTGFPFAAQVRPHLGVPFVPLQIDRRRPERRRGWRSWTHSFGNDGIARILQDAKAGGSL